MTVTKLKVAAVIVGIALIGAAIGIGYAMHSAAGPKPSAAAIAPATTRSAPGEPVWRKEFDKVYTLSPGEDIRRIVPPFIPARMEFIVETVHIDPSHSNGFISDPATTEANGALIVEFDPATGRVERWRRANSSAWPMQNLLSHLTQIPMSSFVVNGKLGGRVPGDWVWRKGATGEQRLEGYRKALEGTSQAFTWEKKLLKRDMIVARGTFVPEQWKDKTIVVHIDPSGKAALSSGGDVGYLFRQFPHIFGRPVINEWKGSDVVRVEFDSPVLGLNELSNEAREEKLTAILKHVGDQLHIELPPETREVESYVIEPRVGGK